MEEESERARVGSLRSRLGSLLFMPRLAVFIVGLCVCSLRFIGILDPFCTFPHAKANTDRLLER